MNAYDTFWGKNPALLYGLAVLIGSAGALFGYIILLFPVILICSPLLLEMASTNLKRRLLLFLAFLATSYGYVYITHDLPHLPEEGVSGTAIFQVDSLSSTTTHIGKQWIYKGTIVRFESKDQSVVYKGLPAKIVISQKEEIRRPPADTSYKVDGILKEGAPGNYLLKVKGDSPWHPVEGRFGLAEYRYLAKIAVGEYIQNHIKDPRNATFLTGIATGDFDDRLMRYEFSRFGLQHIMAISGFHFAIIAGILSMLLSLFFSLRKTFLILIVLLSSYFVFLGAGPSIMRAWITILIALLGFIAERKGSGLNSLGIALLAVVLYDPLVISGIGFQFSFATTAAILLLYGVLEPFSQKLFLKRRLSVMIRMSSLEQHIYFILATFRQAIALAVAVNLVALPMTLYYFQQFPIMSLLYNLFFPFMVSISMLLLIVGVLLSTFGNAVHALNDMYTRFVLNFTYNAPPAMDYMWTTGEVSTELLIIYLSVVFFAAIGLRHKQEEQHEFAYL